MAPDIIQSGSTGGLPIDSVKCSINSGGLPSWNDIAGWVDWWEFTILPSLMLVEKWRKYERFNL
ncbi:hypothetical protein HanLR1_Chr01g0008521 [Helianthus annuus]|nr:hypothetical protein HanHA89_Chr01g0009581 [Helianthus annuus]KAJ0782465.1 hypothetical protein HanLR1_Chr01g0008521 [Helianthus annuus]